MDVAGTLYAFGGNDREGMGNCASEKGSLHPIGYNGRWGGRVKRKELEGMKSTSS